MSRQRVIRSASRRSHGGLRHLAWLAAAAALPVVVTVLVLVAVTLAVLVLGGHGFGDLAQVVAVEWLVVNRVPLAIDGVALGFLPLLPPLVYGYVLARRTRAALSDVEDSSWREVAAALVGTALGSVLVTGLALVVLQSSASDFAVRELGVARALGWSLVVGLAGGGLGAWLHRRRALRDHLPLWAIGGVHLGAAAVAATWTVGAVLLLVSLVTSWVPVGDALTIGKDFWGVAALAGISLGYLPNVALAAGTVSLGGEAHLGEASYSVFAVAPGPVPELPLAAALPTSDPHGALQLLLLLTAVIAVVLARVTAHWFDAIGDAVKASFVGGAIAALATAAVPAVAGGRIGALGSAGTGGLIAAGLAVLFFGVLGALTAALSLAGLTRRRDREREALDRRRRAAARGGTAGAAASGTAVVAGAVGDGDGDDDGDPAPSEGEGAVAAETGADDGTGSAPDEDEPPTGSDDAVGVDGPDAHDTVDQPAESDPPAESPRTDDEDESVSADGEHDDPADGARGDGDGPGPGLPDEPHRRDH